MENQAQSNQNSFEQFLRRMLTAAVKLTVALAVGAILDPITGFSLAAAAFA